MKKVLSVLLVLASLLGILSLTACSSNEAGAKAKVIEVKLTEEEYAFGVDKNQPELLQKTNEFIAKIMSDGTFDEICDKYFGDGTPTPVESVELDASRPDEQLVVATNAGFEPFEYTSGENYLGIDMEIAALLAKELGMELVINNMDFDAVCLSVGESKSDIAMAGLTIKEDRKEYVNFTDPYYQASQMLIVKGSDTEFDSCKTAADVEAILKTKDTNTKIGYQNGTTGQFYVQGDADWGFDGYAVSNSGYKNGSMAVQDMINGNLDYVVIDEAPAKCIVEAFND